MYIHKSTPSTIEAARIAAQAFVKTYSQQIYQDVAEHLAEGEVYTIFDGTSLAGFAIFKMTDSETLYLAGIILRPDVQAQGLAAKVIEMARQETGAKKLTLRTQSLRMWSVGRKLCREWYPRPDEMRLEEGVCPWFGPYVYPVDTLGDSKILRGFYNGPLYGQKPVHHNRRLQKWWDGICDFERGDAVFCCGVF